jgi:DNA helicase-2/ATP-dependent DNA helicase PcrA
MTTGAHPPITGPSTLTEEQRRIVEWGDGPLVVIAGAGTGKTRVIVERVRHLLETRAWLEPENLLVLTYNVKAAAELRTRIEGAVGLATASRIEISNFHSFCQRILTEHADDAGLPPRPDVLDGVGQLLLLREIVPPLRLVYHSSHYWTLANIVAFINRCKDELVRPFDFEAFVAEERRVFEQRYGSFDEAFGRLQLQGNLAPLRSVRGAYAADRARERAGAGDDTNNEHEKAADREARRTIAGDGIAHGRSWFPPDEEPRIDALADTYVMDSAALEVLRLTELATVYRAYEEELARRGALDFGEQIAAVTQLFKTRPNVLRKYQRQFQHILVDEFQDANVAQIELVELLGRTPDRPDNVIVVGDDDQSIYRFRGASFAAFAEFVSRFQQPAAHDREHEPPVLPAVLALEQNFRSGGHVIAGANRLIATNTTRFAPDKRLWTARGDGECIEIHTCAGPDDEAVGIVDAIRSMVGESGRWGDVAVLYRKHKHREAIVARLRDEGIPYTVVGGLSLFGTPEIRDLEQGLRAIANPEDDPALVRMLSAGPWRLDALDILRVTRLADFDKRHLIEAVNDIVETGLIDGQREAAPELRAKLRLIRETIDELNPLTFREGPHTILERYLERTSQVLDLIATGTLEAKRIVANIASLLRFAADWQRANPNGTLAGFVAYLDAYQAAGGELPTSVELSEDLEGVRLMTLYQAKGLEFPIVIVPELLDGEWPVKEGWGGYFPRELLREVVPPGDIHTDEERRLLYVAMTRAQERLVLTTPTDLRGSNGTSRFIGELYLGAGEELLVVQRGAVELSPTGASEAIAEIRRVMPLPTARERRLGLRLQANELIGMLEAIDRSDPETSEAREALVLDLAHIGRAAAFAADEARAHGFDPLTLRTVALDSDAGANLLEVAPLPTRFSYSAFDTYERCPLQYAFRYVYRMPERAAPVAALTFGSTAHAAFEAFTRERRERVARGEPPPTREDLEREFRARWVPTQFGDKAAEESYGRRVQSLLDNFWDGEVAGIGEAIVEEQDFELTLEPADGAPFTVSGQIDRIDRLPSGKVEVIDYKTGRSSSQKDVDQSLQLSLYALACRDALELGTPERVTLYFTEEATRRSTTRTGEQLDATRDDVMARVARMRTGDFAATPGNVCAWCDYRAMCPERI